MVELDNKNRYLQIAFNYDAMMVRQILPSLPFAPNIFIEAGTPYIKQEGMNGIRLIRRLWRGTIIADMKVSDGALNEVAMAREAGANGITAIGSAPTPSLQMFINTCKQSNMLSMIDMLGVKDPLDVLRPLHQAPDVVVLHRGRDEEHLRDTLIQYRHVNRVHSKFDSLISVAGGVSVGEARSAIFNGANIVVANLVKPQDGWTGISTATGVQAAANEFLQTIA